MSRWNFRTTVKILFALGGLSLALLWSEWRDELRAGVYDKGTKAEEKFNKGIPLNPAKDAEDAEIAKNFKAAAEELSRLARAIQSGKVKPPPGLTADDLEKCETCLKKMLELGKIERETGTANLTRAATTEHVFKRGKKRVDCDPQNCTMNVNPADFLDQKVRRGAAGGLQELAALLAHECKHTTQGEEPKEKPEQEMEAYAYQALVLQAFLSEDNLPRLQDALDDANKKAKEPPSDPRQVRTPVGGFDSTRSSDGLSEYTVFYSAPLLRGRTSSIAGIIQFALKMAHPLSIIHLPVMTAAGNEIVLVSGIDFDGTSGVYEAVEVSGGAPVGEIFTTYVPNSHPLSLAYDSSLQSVFVLDTLQDAVVILAPGPEGIPKTPLSQPYATRKEFPVIRRSFSLSLNGLAAGSIILSEEDLRGVDTVNLDEPLTALFDTNSNGASDGEFSFPRREAVTFPPGFLESPSAGQSALEVSGSFHAELAIRITDPAGSIVLEVLGEKAIQAGNIATIPLSRKLLAGEFVQLADVTNGFTELPVEVSP